MAPPRKPDPQSVYVACRWTDDGEFAVLVVTTRRNQALAACRRTEDFIMAIPDETIGVFRASRGYFPMRQF
jgi:hypothetical protein